MLPLVSGIIRHAMTFGGGILIDKDYTTLTEWDGAIAAVIALVGVVWSMVVKAKAK